LEIVYRDKNMKKKRGIYIAAVVKKHLKNFIAVRDTICSVSTENC